MSSALVRSIRSAAGRLAPGARRAYSILPRDLEEAAAAARSRYPARRAHPPEPAKPAEAVAKPSEPAGAATEGGAAAEAAADAGAASGGVASAAGSAISEAQRRSIEGARIATDWMFPWERRQMSGEPGGLRTWEKIYWGVFVMGLGFILINRLAPEDAEKAAKEAERERAKKEKRRERARAVLAGAAFSGIEEDPFEGMEPAEIEKIVKEVAKESGASEDDPFEGMSPEEIDAYLEKQKAAA